MLLLGCRGDDGTAPVPEPAPEAPEPISIGPDEPLAGVHDLTCVADGPVHWLHDGEPATLEQTVPAWDVRPGLWTCVGPHGSVSVDVPAVGGNLLVVLLDDIGVDKVGHYGLHPVTPPTPTLDRLAEEGIRFVNAYATPLCSPTRAALLTGRHPTRTGVGYLVGQAEKVDYLSGEVTLAHVLSDQGYATSLAGKWHLSGFDGQLLEAPLRAGFDWHAGTLANPSEAFEALPPRNYFRWQENRNGSLVVQEGYLTSATVDDAVDRIEAMPEPWFLFVPLNGAHVPLHQPPDTLLSSPGVLNEDPDLFDAMVEATDRELGRLLDGLGPQADRTTVVVVSDNGTPDHAMRAPSDPTRDKGTVSEGGVRVPMYVVGPLVAVAGSTTDALVHVVDVFASGRDLAGAPVDDIPRDGVSWLPYLASPDRAPRREVLFTESFEPNGFAERDQFRRMVRDDHYKLQEDSMYGLQLFELVDGVLDEGVAIEAPDPAQQAALERLEAAMAAQVAEFAAEE